MQDTEGGGAPANLRDQMRTAFQSDPMRTRQGEGGHPGPFLGRIEDPAPTPTGPPDHPPPPPPTGPQDHPPWLSEPRGVKSTACDPMEEILTTELVRDDKSQAALAHLPTCPLPTADLQKVQVRAAGGTPERREKNREEKRWGGGPGTLMRIRRLTLAPLHCTNPPPTRKRISFVPLLAEKKNLRLGSNVTSCLELHTTRIHKPIRIAKQT